jgi:hypothetical protein
LENRRNKRLDFEHLVPPYWFAVYFKQVLD